MPPLLFNFLSWQNYTMNLVRLLMCLFNPPAPALHSQLLRGFVNCQSSGAALAGEFPR